MADSAGCSLTASAWHGFQCGLAAAKSSQAAGTFLLDEGLQRLADQIVVEIRGGAQGRSSPRGVRHQLWHQMMRRLIHLPPLACRWDAHQGLSWSDSHVHGSSLELWQAALREAGQIDGGG